MSNSQRSHSKKKHGVTPRTLRRNVRAFAVKSKALFDDMIKFVDAHCKSKSSAAKEKFLDELATIVDGYAEYNCQILTWCHKNGVDVHEFMCDVVNEEVS